MQKVAIGHRIQQARKEAGMTQEELAQKLDMSTKYISNIECGEKVARLETFVAIANALNTDANTLLQDVLECIHKAEGLDTLAKIETLPIGQRNQLLRMIEAYMEW